MGFSAGGFSGKGPGKVPGLPGRFWRRSGEGSRETTVPGDTEGRFQVGANEVFGRVRFQMNYCISDSLSGDEIVDGRNSG